MPRDTHLMLGFGKVFLSCELKCEQGKDATLVSSFEDEVTAVSRGYFLNNGVLMKNCPVLMIEVVCSNLWFQVSIVMVSCSWHMIIVLLVIWELRKL